ncbi:hypothetical protein BaRGS_00012690 [Batillaria attramentaria]|uniref:Uncharacterized protein n=1 Tax=Batillaria attramentaria TaxID=370345 RepID=A0ABD0L8U0_9CAEN
MIIAFITLLMIIAFITLLMIKVNEAKRRYASNTIQYASNSNKNGKKGCWETMGRIQGHDVVFGCTLPQALNSVQCALNPLATYRGRTEDVPRTYRGTELYLFFTVRTKEDRLNCFTNICLYIVMRVSPLSRKNNVVPNNSTREKNDVFPHHRKCMSLSIVFLANQ